MSIETTNPTSSETPEAPVANRPIWQLVVGMALFIAVLFILGGWALPFVIFAILAMIILHELGHFATAKWTGMRVTEFFAGFGPRLWSKQVADTEYGIKAYPLGGYVRIPGMTMTEEVAPELEDHSYRQASFPRRVLVVSAGSIMHMLIALVCAFAFVIFVGQSVATHDKVTGFSKWVGYVQTPAQAAGLQKGDVIVAVNGKALTTSSALSSAMANSVGKTVNLAVRRHGTTVTLTVAPVAGANGGCSQPATNATASGSPGCIGIGIAEVQVHHRVGVLAAVPAAFSLVGNATSQIIGNIVHLFSPNGIAGVAHNVAHPGSSLSGTNVQSRPMSIVGITQVLVDDANHNPGGLLALFMLVNISFALLNMLPMLPLDGGHVAIAVYERLRTRRGQPAYHADVNKLMPVAYAFVAMLGLLFLSALYLDIVHPVV